MLNGFDTIPDTFREIYKPSSYSRWYHMIWMVPVLSAALVIIRVMDVLIRDNKR